MTLASELALSAGAPLVITSDLLNTFGITAVVRGSCSESSRSSNVEAQRYREPKERGMLQCAPLMNCICMQLSPDSADEHQTT